MKTFTQYFNERQTTTLYHATTTGPNDEKLHAFMQGIQPHASTGHGQGTGTYYFTNLDQAKRHAIMLHRKWLDYTDKDPITGSEHGGRPMIVAYQDQLNPNEYELDYEVQALHILRFLKNYLPEINRYLNTHPAHGTGRLSDYTIYHIDNTVDTLRVWTTDPTTLEGPAHYYDYHQIPFDSLYEKGGHGTMSIARSLHEVLTAITQNHEIHRAYKAFTRSIQKNEKQNPTQSEPVKRAWKYTGYETKTPSQILVNTNGDQWIDARQYLAQKQKEAA